LDAKWKKRRVDRLDRLAQAIEAVGAHDQHLLDESLRVDRIKSEGALLLYGICREFVDALNSRLSEPSVMLAPFEWELDNFHDGQTNFFQISLRGRLLQLEFQSTDEMYSTEDFRLPYVLHGSFRSFNQESLEKNRMGEQRLFCCPLRDTPVWHFFDARTYRTGNVDSDYLAAELERLL
jgi:hypothetical protein